jgi:hypothetical protein
VAKQIIKIEMNKNDLIRGSLEYHINNAKKMFKEYSFPKLLEHELNTAEDVVWLPSPDFDANAAKEESKNQLIDLLNDKPLHEQLENLLNTTFDVNTDDIQEHIENQLINSFSEISSSILSERNGFDLNLLFLEHDYSPAACFCGYEDLNYEFKVLSGQEYLEFDYNKEIFNGIGKFDYTPFLLPMMQYEEEIGEDKVHAINEAISMTGYLDEVKKYFLLYAYLGTHLCFNRINDKIRKIDMPWHEEVFVFVNEHDCEQLNVFVL